MEAEEWYKLWNGVEDGREVKDKELVLIHTLHHGKISRLEKRFQEGHRLGTRGTEALIMNV